MSSSSTSADCNNAYKYWTSKKQSTRNYPRNSRHSQPYCVYRKIRQRCQMQTRIITNTRTLLTLINRNLINAEKDMRPIHGCNYRNDFYSDKNNGGLSTVQLRGKKAVTFNNASDYWVNGLLSDYIGWTNGLTDKG